MKLRGVTYSSAEQFMMKCKANIGGGGFRHRITHHEDGPPGETEKVVGGRLGEQFKRGRIQKSGTQ